jgi:hypothetical protein
MTPKQTRREAQKLTPEILGQYHTLVMNADFEGFDKLLDQYAIEDDKKQELKDEFRRYAERALRAKWRP